MAVAYRTISGIVNNNGTGTLTLTEPAGAVVNDLFIACIAYRSNADTAALPAGWTLIEKRYVASVGTTTAQAGSSLLMAWIKRGATAPSFAFTGFNNVAIGRVIRLDGQDLTSPIDVSTSLLIGTAATTGSTASITMTRTGGMWIGMASAGSEGTNGAAYSNHLLNTGGAAMTEIADNSTTLGADVDLGVAYLASSITTLETKSYAWTHAPSSRMAGALVHIKPPAAAVGRSFAVIC